MIKQMMAIKDTATQAFMEPWFVRTVEEGQRAFTDAVNKPGTPIHAHPADYELFLLGEFDDNTGQVSGQQRHIIAGHACRKPVSDQNQLDLVGDLPDETVAAMNGEFA